MQAAYQRAVSAGFQGESGAFSEDAVVALLGNVATRGFRTFAQVIEALNAGEIRYAVLPHENTLHGKIAAVHDLLAAHPMLRITGEAEIPVEQCLIALPGATLAEIDTVTSHPVALTQCSRFLQRHAHWQAVESHDTAGAVREIMESGRRATAAIGPARAAEHYGAHVLQHGIQDDVTNITRFWLIVHD